MSQRMSMHVSGGDLVSATWNWLGEVAGKTLTGTCLSNRGKQGKQIWTNKRHLQDSQSNGSCRQLSWWKVWVLVVSVGLDFYLGWLLHQQDSLLVLQYTGHHQRENCLPDLLFQGTEFTVSQVKWLLQWLMENPAGLKLNSVLSQALGNFFLYHIHLWVTYVYLILPSLTSLHTTLLAPALPLLPLSLQIAVTGDILSLLFLHVYCFFAYARRVTVSQLKGCLALARLFTGKKYNPLRKRVDSADATLEQLFLGTVIFTILLFLLPTSLTFYAVFLALRTLADVLLLLLNTAVRTIQWVPWLMSSSSCY